MKKMKGQVWIETVLYTLLGLTLIGIALGVVMPQINQARDKALVDQAVSSLNGIDEKISEIIERGAGNVRSAEILMKNGEIYINSTGDEILLVLMGLRGIYSEPGVEVSNGRVNVLTEEGPQTSTTYLKIRYNVNLTYNGEDSLDKFVASPTPYKFSIENKGVSNGTLQIEINEIS